ncbi:hypothetical protein C8T65DRAFT_707291 [Cerioporus squamosus]|nr:hypothetical protein C8T65DRAFT_707291 [Cerioporus squamosus]
MAMYIFELACSESVRTVSALSRTSKAFRRVFAPVRFRSVRLNSLKQVEKFLAAYEAAVAEASASDSDPPHVRHLLLAFLPGQTDMFVLGPSFHFRDYHSWKEEKVPWNERFVSLVTRLFDLVSPGLLTMTVLQNDEIQLPYVRCSFPALRELTLLDEDRMFFRVTTESYWLEPSDKEFHGAGPPPDKEALAANPLFPALERRHLVAGKWETKLPTWSVVAPRLTHLRISSASEECCGALCNALLAAPPKFPSLFTVIVWPHFIKDAPAGETQLQGLHDIADARPGVEFVLLPVLERAFKQYERLPREWSLRQTRGKGPWVTAEPDKP